MVRAELESLIRTSLKSLGAREVFRAEDVTHYRLEDDLATRFGRDDLFVTFNSSVAAHRDDVELVTAGSFMYDLILRLVRERGRAAAGWLVPDPGLDAEAAIVKAVPRLEGRSFTAGREVWGSIFLFSFRLGFYFDTPHEKLYTVRVDVERRRVRHETHPERLLEAAGPPPPEEAAASPAPAPEPEKAFRMAWGRVEEEVARLTARYQGQGQEEMEEEIRTIETYYRQLIDEEKRVRLQKNTRRGRDESDERIEMLKLEWDRRIAEEKSRFSPDVSVVLSCASCLRTPLAKWRARPGRGSRETAVDVWLDRHTGEAWPAPKRARKTRKPSASKSV